MSYLTPHLKYLSFSADIVCDETLLFVKPSLDIPRSNQDILFSHFLAEYSTKM